ncbi:TadE family type IV pilus minor pilin [Streptomyces sp. NPDC047928]|uniref:TadE family type IV pilus minor pilin n=1 Tax=unclassified Streptomyces TaxID=2593676 RepID=UPI00371B9D32
MTLPALVLFTAALLWALSAAAAHIQCVDAARAGARAAARSDPPAVAAAAARSAAPHGATVAVEREGDLWRVRVDAPAPGPGPLALTLHAEAAALAEDTLGESTPGHAMPDHAMPGVTPRDNAIQGGRSPGGGVP